MARDPRSTDTGPSTLRSTFVSLGVLGTGMATGMHWATLMRKEYNMTLKGLSTNIEREQRLDKRVRLFEDSFPETKRKTEERSLVSERRRGALEAGEDPDSFFYKPETAEEFFGDDLDRKPVEPEEIVSDYDRANLREQIRDFNAERAGLGASESFASSRNIWKNMIREYGPIEAILDKSGIRIDQVRLAAGGYELHFRDASGAKGISFLPSYKKGIITKGTATYIPSTPARLRTAHKAGSYMGISWAEGDRILFADSYGFSVLSELKRQTNFREGISARRISSMIDSAVSKYLEEYAGNTGEISQVDARKYIIEELTSLDPREAEKNAVRRGRVASAVDDAVIIERGVNRGQRTILKNRLSMAAVSESSFVTKGKVGSVTPLFLYPLQNMNKAAQNRFNILRGLPERYTAEGVARQLGFVSEKQAARLAETLREHVVGGLTNIGFVFGQIEGIYDGANMLVAGGEKGPIASLEQKIAQLQEKIAGEPGHPAKAYMEEEIRRLRKNTVTEKFRGVNHKTILVKEFTEIDGKRFLEPNIRSFMETHMGITGLGHLSPADKQLEEIFSVFKNIADLKDAAEGHADMERFSRIEQKGPIKIRKGTVLGIDPDTKREIRADKDLWLIKPEMDKGHIRLHVAEDIPVGVGRTKDVQTKTVTNQIRTHGDLKTAFSFEGKIDREIGRWMSAGQLEGAVEMLVEGKNIKNFAGGGLGLGMVEKLLSDVAGLKLNTLRREMQRDPSYIGSTAYQKEVSRTEQQLKSVVRRILGQDAAEAIEVKFNEKGLRVQPKGEFTSSSPVFERLIDLETRVYQAQDGNPVHVARLAQYADKLEKDIIGITKLKNFRVSGYAADNLKIVSSRRGQSNLPLLLFRSDGKGLGALITRSFESVHQASSPTYTSTARGKRTINGYAGGFRTTLDHIVNAQRNGMEQYVAYLHHMLDYNMDYLEDKMDATGKWLSEVQFREYSEGGKGVGFSGRKSMRVLSLEQGNADLIGRLVETKTSAEIEKAAIRFKVDLSNLEALAGYIDHEDIAQLAKANALSIDQLEQRGLLGLRGNSAVVVNEEAMQGVMKMLNSVPKGEVAYLKLPRVGYINGRAVKYVPLHRIDQGDIFELLVHQSSPGVPRDLEVGRKMYTGSAFFANQMTFLKEVAMVQQAMAQGNMDDVTSQRMQGILDTALSTYERQLRQAFDSKRSPAKIRLFETSLPYSNKGRVTSTAGIEMGTVGMSADNVVSLMTQDKFRSVESVNRFLEKAESLESLTERLKGMKETLGKGGLDQTRAEFRSAVERLGDHKAYRRVKRSFHEESRKITRRLRRTSKSEFQEKLRNLSLGAMIDSNLDSLENLKAGMAEGLERAKIAREILLDLGMEQEGNRIVMPKTERVTLIPRRDIQMYLSRAPELDSTSSRVLNLRIRNDNGISKSAMEMIEARVAEGMLKSDDGLFQLNIHDLKAIKGDLDGDLLGGVVTSMQYLDEVSLRIGAARKITEELGFRKTKGGINFEALTVEQIEEALSSRAFMAEAGNAKLPVPVNLSSVSSMAAIRNSEQREFLESVTLRAAVEESVEKSFGTTMSAQKKKAVSGRITRNIMRKNTIPGIEEKDIRVATHMGDTQEVLKTKSSIDMKILETDQESFIRKIYSGMSPQKREMFDRISSGAKESFAEMKKEIQQEQLKDFSRIKGDTPKAYNLRRNIIQLAESYTENKREQMFVRLLASDKIAQNVISAKHGTPNIIIDVEKTFRNLLDGTKPLPTTEDIAKLARGNFSVTITDENMLRDLKRRGYMEGTEEISSDMFEKYLGEKQTYLKELHKANLDADEEILKRIQGGEIAEKQLKNERAKFIEARMGNRKLKKWEYSSWKTGKMSFDAETKLSNAKKFRETLLESTMRLGKEGTEAEIRNSTEKEMEKFYTNLVRNARMYHEMHGVSVFDDASLRITGRFSPHPSGAENIVSEARKLIPLIRGKKSVEFANPVAERIARMAVHTAGIEEAYAKNFSQEEHMEAFQRGKKREIRAFLRESSEAIEKESSPFRPRGVLNTFIGRAERRVGTELEERLLRSASRLKGASIGIGLLVGALTGMTVNQVVSGYSVPGLERTTGLGGEYFERRSGIMGKEAEVLLEPRPARVKPLYREQAGMADLFKRYTEYSGRPGEQSVHQNRYRGMIV